MITEKLQPNEHAAVNCHFDNSNESTCSTPKQKLFIDTIRSLLDKDLSRRLFGGSQVHDDRSSALGGTGQKTMFPARPIVEEDDEQPLKEPAPQKEADPEKLGVFLSFLMDALESYIPEVVHRQEKESATVPVQQTIVKERPTESPLPTAKQDDQPAKDVLQDIKKQQSELNSQIDLLMQQHNHPPPTKKNLILIHEPPDTSKFEGKTVTNAPHPKELISARSLKAMSLNLPDKPLRRRNSLPVDTTFQISLLGEDRLREIEDKLRSHFKVYDHSQLKRMIWKCSSEFDDELDALRVIIPTPAEVDFMYNNLKIWNLLTSSESEIRKRLGTEADRFLLNLISNNSKRSNTNSKGCVTEDDILYAKYYKKRIDAWIFKTQFDRFHREILCKLNNLTKACREMERSEDLIKFFGIVLSCCNFITYGGDGCFDGFQLSSLNKLQEAKHDNIEVSLLVFLSKFCERKYPDINAQFLQRELLHVTRAAKIDIVKMRSEIESNKQYLKLIKELSSFYQEHRDNLAYDDESCRRICSNKSIQTMENEINEIDRRFGSTMKKLQEIAVLYSEDVQQLSDFSRMFSYVANFLNSFAMLQNSSQQNVVAPTQAKHRRSLPFPSKSKVLSEELIPGYHPRATSDLEADLSSDTSDSDTTSSDVESNKPTKCNLM